MVQDIDSLLQEKRVFPPRPESTTGAHVQSVAEYDRLYRQSIDDPNGFWQEQAKEQLTWFALPQQDSLHDFSQIGEVEAPYVSYFKGGTLNASYNCLDRHLQTFRKNKAAILWQGENEHERRTLTYRELHNEVCRAANVLKALGVKKGSVVTIYLPMIPELSIAVLACARIGAVHSVVFSEFSADALKSRIQDCQTQVVITADVGFHAGKVNELKKKVDRALTECPSVTQVLVYNRGNVSIDMRQGRDHWWHERMYAPEISKICEALPVDAEDPLFTLYTSGSTGKPKGVLHTTAGYLLYASLTFRYVFDIREEDTFWCTADVGWITGHSYLIYGPLSNGATTVMFEGIPTYPTADRFWKIISDYQVSVFYTAPTAIRALMRLGEELPGQHDLSSLRVLGSVGEPINPEAWMWYHRVIGKERCPIVDTWWQTETGGIMITTLPGAHPTKPGSAGLPFFGVVPEILRQDGTPVAVNEGGSLVLTQPWPGMLRGVYGDAKNELVRNVYFTKFPGKYFTGDGCRRDEDGYYWLLGRIDDVINVSAHRFSTAEIESALVSHTDVAEAAVVGIPHETKGQGIYCYVTVKANVTVTEELRKTLIDHVRSQISPIATPERIHFTVALPKTRSGKIMRRILRKIAEGNTSDLGDTSTLADPSVVDALLRDAG